MSKRPALVIPEGLELELVDDALRLRFDGDAHIMHSAGKRVTSIRVTGDLVLALPSVSGSVVVGGKLSIFGDFEAGAIHAGEIEIGGGNVKCRSITASERITVGASELAVDAIMAPEIVLDPKTHGRVTVIESQNARNATRIKGGFSLADYEDMFGPADTFLAERGLIRLEAGQLLPEPAAEANPTPPKAKAKPSKAPKAEPEPAAEPAIEDEEPVDDPLSLSFEDLEPLAETGDNERIETNNKLTDAMERILACYEGGELPPSISDLREIIEASDHERLATHVTDIWNALLSFHQKRGIRPHHQVTHAFNLIHSLVTS